MKRFRELIILGALLVLWGCQTDPLFGKVEGVAATITAPNQSTPAYDMTVAIADVKARGYSDTAKTGVDGRFSFPHAPDATYRMTVTSPNGKFVTRFFAEVLDGASPDGVVVTLAPARVDTFVEFTGCYDEMSACMRKLEYPCGRADAADLAMNPDPLEGMELAFLNSGCETVEAGNPITVENLREFVSGGGRLIASDRAWPFIAAAWPEDITWGENPEIGIGGQTLNARFTDADSGKAAGVGSWELEYNQPSWALPAATRGTVFVRGDVRTTAGTRADAPLLIGFKYGDGYVVYTTFGWERQLDRDRMALRVFQYLIANK